MMDDAWVGSRIQGGYISEMFVHRRVLPPPYRDIASEKEM